jgi:hypothetical protein
LDCLWRWLSPIELPLLRLFRHLHLFNLATSKMVKKKFIQRRCVRKVPRSSLARSPRVAVLAASSSEGSSLSSSSLPASLSLGVQEASVVEKAPPARTSTPVPSLRKDEDLGAAPVVRPLRALLYPFDGVVVFAGLE